MNKLNKAFTLIEMLVVISIIGILAGIAIPAYQHAIKTGKMTNAMNNARQISLSLRMYANDNDGAFPTKQNNYGEDIVTSNDAFRSLIPAYLDIERVFTVGGSKAGPSADEQIQDAAHILQPGENHWAFVSGLTATSKSNWPLIVDHTDGTGHYVAEEGKYGGTWGGTNAVVIYTDGSSHILPLAGTGDQRYLARPDDKTKNALAVNEYMGDDVKLLEPAH
jgi:prepilin-type N-terminal cleavage/methylation domain-containing protein